MMKKKTSPKEDMITLLARRDHSKHELLRKMRAKNYAEEEIQEAVATLGSKGFLNDQRFTENLVRSHRRKGHGPLRIFALLESHQIDSTIIAQHLDITDNEWLEATRTVWHKRFKGQKPVDFTEKAKQMRFLNYRGFTEEQIKALFKQLDE